MAASFPLLRELKLAETQLDEAERELKTVCEEFSHSYRAEQQRIDAILKAFGPPLLADEHVAQHVATLAEIATVTDSISWSFPNVLSSLISLQDALDAAKEGGSKIDFSMSTSRRHVDLLDALVARTSQDVARAHVESKELAARQIEYEREVAFFHEKVGQYASQLAALEQDLSAHGFHAEIKHTSLKRLAHKIATIEDENRKMEAKLAQWQSLPLDLHNARLHVLKAAREREARSMELAARVSLATS